jgi:hypothetical protein
MSNFVEATRTSPDRVEAFAPWPLAQRTVHRLAYEAPPALWRLRRTVVLPDGLAERIAAWFAGPATADAAAVRASYRALARDTERLWAVIAGAPGAGGLGVHVEYVHAEDDPYADGAELCAQLRRHRTMELRTIACDAPHPLLGGEQGGVVDRLRVVHDVFGHAALGVGFDLQSEFAAWLQCRTLFSAEARPAAFCELVGAVAAYVVDGEKPALRADLPPAALVAACETR